MQKNRIDYNHSRKKNYEQQNKYYEQQSKYKKTKSNGI